MNLTEIHDKLRDSATLSGAGQAVIDFIVNVNSEELTYPTVVFSPLTFQKDAKNSEYTKHSTIVYILQSSTNFPPNRTECETAWHDMLVIAEDILDNLPYRDVFMTEGDCDYGKITTKQNIWVSFKLTFSVKNCD